ncbi:MAG TPA: aldehyde ferredoxin oxidoreductase family protein [Candidatus Hydrothermia bacterium]|nr:aldehyde ferredoxin oxidoreductase family protein [Candidatus Hydrothermia bacterium]
MKGYAGRVLRINLTKKEIKIEALSEEMARRYLGGVGFGARILYNEVPAKADPLGPDNKLIITPGAFVASGLPTMSKTALNFKSPLTGGYGRAMVGAYLGEELKKAGYDSIIIEGKSEKPCYILIEDDKVEIRDASELWGMLTTETHKKLQEMHGKVRTGVIGPAGEKLSKISEIDFEERQAARGGGGAVMGSKNLKAIAVKGTKEIEYYNKSHLRELIIKWGKILKDHPATEADVKYGSGEFYEWVNKERGTFPALNWKYSYMPVYDNLKEGEKSHLDPYYWAPKYTVKNRPCPHCTKPCGRYLKITDGKYAGTEVEGIEYEILYSLGGDLGIDDIGAVAKMNKLCDEYGLDAISAGVTLAWAMECYEKGLLTKEDTGGLDLRFGNDDAAVKAIEMMGKREGKLGELLFNGSKEASEKLGKDSWKYAIHIKGLELPAYDIRGLKGVALAFSVSTRGGCHLTGGAYGVELTGGWWKIKGVDRTKAEWKGFEIKTLEDLMAIYDATGACKFSRHMFFIEAFPEMFKAVTGWDISEEELWVTGERIYNITKMFNIREGFSRKDDHLPWKVSNAPIVAGPSKGLYVSEEELNRMLDEYYLTRGWSREGVPTKAKLSQVGLKDLAEESFAAEI